MIINNKNYTKEEEYLLNLLFSQQDVLNELITKFNERVAPLEITPENAIDAMSFVIHEMNEKVLEIHNKITQIELDADARNN